MHKRDLTQTGVLAVTALMGLGLTVALLLFLGTWTGSALAAPPVANPPALALDPTAGITIVKTAPAIVNQALGAGQTLIPYSLTIQNPSGFTVVAGAIVTDGLPAGTTLLGGTTGPDWSGAFPAGDVVVTYTLDVDTSNTDVDVGGYQASVAVPVQDGTTFVNTRYCFSGTVGAAVRTFCENVPVGTIIRAPDFSLVENTTTPVCAGGRVTYTLNVTNPGGVRTSLPFTITGQITPVLNVLPGTISDGGTWMPPTILWNVGTNLLPSGGNQVVRTFAVTVSTGVPHGTLLTNTYVVTSPEVLPTVSSWQSVGVMVTRPTAVFTTITPVCQNDQVMFYNASLGTTSYEWDFGDGSPISTVASPTHMYAGFGTYTAILTATGACGTDVTTSTVTVFPSPSPVLQITPDPTQLGLTTYFTDAGALGAFWDWNFGDGTTASTILPNTSHTYTGLPGMFTVVLTSTSGPGCSLAVTRSLQVNPGAPYAVNLNAWPLQPPVGSSSAVTATVTDQWGNPVLDGTTIDFTATPPPAVIVPSADPTSGGLAHATVTSTLAGPVTVRGTAPNAVFGTTVVTFTPGVPFVLTLVVDPLTLPVGSGAALTATVLDGYNNPIPGQVITFTYAGNLGSGALAPQTDTAGALGQAHSTVMSTLPGAKIVTATASATVWDTVVVTFTPGAPYTITLVADPLNPVVNSSAALTATVVDQFNNLVPGEVITFSTSDSLGLGSITPANDTTDGAGEAHASIMSTAAGPKTVRATASNFVSGTVVVNFQAALPNLIVLMASPPTQTVGLSSVLGARVLDQFFNPVPGEVISFTTSANLGLGSINPVTDVTNSSGWAYSNIGSTVPGAKLVVATAVSSLINSSTVITFFAGAPYSLTLTAIPSTLGVGNTAALSATLADQYANPLSGYTVAFTTTAPLGLGALTPLGGTTNGAGEVTSALSSTLPGVKTVVATQGGLSATVQVIFTVGPATTVTVVGVPDTLPAGQNSALTATVTDQFSNPIAGTIVMFSSSGGGLGGGAIRPLADTTDVNGQAHSTISSTLPGLRWAQAQESSMGVTGTTAITWTAGPPANLTLVAQPITVTVGGASHLTATLTDQYSNPLPGQVITFTYSGSLGSGSLSPATDTTDAAGQAHSAISSTLPGLRVVTATAPTGLAATATVFFILSEPYTVTLVADPATPSVDAVAVLTATVVDQFNVPVVGQVITFTHGGSLGLGALVPITDATDVNGEAHSVVSSTLVGLVPLTATAVNGVSGTTSVTFSPGAPASLSLVADPVNQAVGGTSALTATLRDQYNNPTPGYAVNFATTSPLGSGGLSPLVDTTDAAGEATSAISSTLTGVKTITATYGGLLSTAQVTFSPGTLTTIVVVPNPATVTVGATQPFTATGYDQYSNPMPVAPTWTTNGGSVSPGPAATTLFTAQTTPASGRLVTATQGAVVGTAVVDIVAGALTTITVAPNPATVSVGATQPFTASGYDLYNNPVPVTPAWTTDGGAVDPGPGATTVYTAPSVPASGLLVTATQGAVAGSAVVNVVAGTLTTITVTPNPVTVTVGSTQVFVATGYDQFNNLMPVTPVWTTDGGSVIPGPGATTVFTAQTTPATGRLVTATQGAVSGAAVVNIVHGSAVTVELTPAASTIAAGQSQPYTVTARDAYANPWDVTALSAYTITPGAGGAWVGNIYSGEFAGTWTVTATYLSLNDTAVLTVTHVPTATSAALSPNPHTVGAGGQVIYTLIATDTYNNSWDATASGTYTITPAAGGSWLANVYTSQYTGTWAVTGTVPNAVATAVLTVTELPAASFTRVPTGSVCVAATVLFTDTSSGSPSAWLWDLGDGVITDVQHTTHAYAVTGSFTVTLAVTNAYGSDSVTDTLDVISVPSVAIVRTPPGNVCVGANVAFTATNSGGPGTYLWSFGDGITATGQSVSHAYAGAATYTVWLTASNGCGTDVVSTTVTVDPAPVASFVRAPAGGVSVGTTIQFTDTSSGGPTAWQWDFGDGVITDVQHPAHAYVTSGTFAVTLTVTGTCGSDNVTGSVTVLSGCVGASITGLTSDSPVDLGQTMYFTATVVGTTPITYTWDFGDATPPVSGVGLVTTSHVYGSSGSFTVTLTVTNACGVDTDVLTVTVNCVLLSGADFTWDPASPATTETVTFTGTVTGGSPPINYTWNWGDGTPDGTGNPAFHTFTVSGTYTVLMTATNPCGLMTATHAITATGGVFTPTYGVELAPPTAAQSGAPGALVVYALVLTNTGNVAESFDVGVGVVGEPWATVVVPTRTATLAPNGTTPVTVSVQISATATAGQQSVATVTASSVISPVATDSSVLTTTATTACTPPTVTSLISNSPVDQGQTMYFTATVTGDTPITYTWDFGDATPPLSGVGLNTTGHVYVSSGVYTVTLTATNSCGFDSGILLVTVNALAGVPDHITLVAVPAVLPLTSTSSLTATVYDGLNALLAGQVLTFTSLDPLGGGAVVPLTATTDAQGQAMAIVTSTLTGTKLILATAYNLVSGSTTVVFYGDLNQRVYLPLVMRNYAPPVPPTPTPTITPTPTATPTPTPPPPTLDLVADPSFLLMGDTSLLTATALDSYGAPIAGMSVSFSTSDPLGGGALTPFSTTTDVNGQVTATLRSTLEGMVRVTAQASNGTSDIASVYFHSADFCAPRLISTATTGPGAREVALDTAGDRAFVAHALGVTVIDTHGFYTIAEINAIASAHGIAYDPDRNRIWVTTREGGAGRVRVLDGNTYAVIADLPAGVLPHSAAYNPANGRVYVSNFGNSWVTVYNAAAMSMEHILTNFTAPAHIAVNPVTNKIYVANHGLNAHLTVIDGATHSSHHIGTTLLDAYAVAVDPTRNLIYAASIAQGRLVVINGVTDTQIGRMDIWRSGGRKVPLRVIEVNPNMGSTGHLFLITSSEDGGEDQLLLIPNGWPTLGTPVPLDVASYPQEGIALDQDENRIWVTSVGSGQATVVQDGMPVCSIPFLAGLREGDLFEIEVFTTP